MFSTYEYIEITSCLPFQKTPVTKLAKLFCTFFFQQAITFGKGIQHVIFMHRKMDIISDNFYVGHRTKLLRAKVINYESYTIQYQRYES
jgi:hypothetical protein